MSMDRSLAGTTCQCIQSGMDERYWPEFIRGAIYKANRTPPMLELANADWIHHRTSTISGTSSQNPIPSIVRTSIARIFKSLTSLRSWDGWWDSRVQPFIMYGFHSRCLIRWDSPLFGGTIQVGAAFTDCHRWNPQYYRDSYDTYEPPQLFEHMNISLNLLCRRVRILQTWDQGGWDKNSGNTLPTPREAPGPDQDTDSTTKIEPPTPTWTQTQQQQRPRA